MVEDIVLAVLFAWLLGGAIFIAGGAIAERGRTVVFPDEERRRASNSETLELRHGPMAAPPNRGLAGSRPRNHHGRSYRWGG